MGFNHVKRSYSAERGLMCLALACAAFLVAALLLPFSPSRAQSAPPPQPAAAPVPAATPLDYALAPSFAGADAAKVQAATAGQAEVAESSRGASESRAAASILDYVLAPNDRLRIVVFGEPDLSGEFVIDASGTVSLPLVGDIRAEGVNLRTFQRELERLFRDGQYLIDPRVSAQIMNFRPIFLLGEVKSPGEHDFVAGLTLLNAIAQAGGFTPLANARTVHIRREGAQDEVPVEVRSGVAILPGDTIRVGKSAAFIFGEVRTQGEMPIPEGLTVRTAVAQAGGFTELADTQNIFIKRAGTDVEVAVPFDSGELVRPGDTLRVDKSSFFIMGEVASTGEFPMRPGLTVTNAAILAGGFTLRADTRRAFIRHAGELQEQRYRITNDLFVRKGDTIRIPERFF